MDADDPGLVAVAEAIADRVAVDWSSVHESAHQALDLRELQIIAAVAEVHRQAGAPLSGASFGDVLATVSVAPPVTTATSGTPWGPLIVLDRVGSGSFGTVYRAKDPTLDHEVALKRVRLSADSPRSQAAAIVREGQLLARVRHENVITVHGALEINGEVGIWMDFVRGRTLAQIIRDDGPMSAQEAAVVGESLCRALAAVHQAGLIHRDIKAANVMREAGGRIVMLDFGAGTEASAEFPGASRVAGTPLYMAPELFEGQAASVRSDLYSLGVLLFYLVTGRYPVVGNTFAQVRATHQTGRRLLLSDARAALPRSFVKVVERALCPDPLDRYGTAGAMLQDLTESNEVPAVASRVPQIVLAAAVFGTAGLWTLGLVTSIAFNQTFGRVGEFGRESIGSYWVWGFRALIGPTVIMLVTALLFGGAKLAWTTVSAVVRNLRPSGAAAQTARLRRVVTRAAPEVVCRSVVAAQGVVVAIWFWAFRSIIDATTSPVATANAETLALLQSSGLGRLAYAISASVLVLAMVAVWLAVFRRVDFSSRPPNYIMMSAAFGFIALIALAYIVPYRIIFQSTAQRVQFGAMRCYEIGAGPTEALIYCPEAALPRNRVVAKGDPQLERTGIIESVFTPAP